MKKGQKGFTLVELLIVIAIIGILAAIAIPKYNTADQSAKIAQAKATLTTIESAAEIYKAQNNRYPNAADDWTAFKTNFLKRDPDNKPVTGVYGIAADGKAFYTVSTVNYSLDSTDAQWKTAIP